MTGRVLCGLERHTPRRVRLLHGAWWLFLGAGALALLAGWLR